MNADKQINHFFPYELPLSDKEVDIILARATEFGVTRMACISPAEVVVEDQLATFCIEPKCENYGLSMSCPPNVSGPEGFRDIIKTSLTTVVVRIDVPSDALFSAERPGIMRLLHETVAGIESCAKELGYNGSKAFAGGSCKQSFCDNQPGCRVLSGDGQCRNPTHARPSMSGHGVNVAKLMSSAGWAAEIAEFRNNSDDGVMSWIAGIVLIRR